MDFFKNVPIGDVAVDMKESFSPANEIDGFRWQRERRGIGIAMMVPIRRDRNGGRCLRFDGNPGVWRNDFVADRESEALFQNIGWGMSTIGQHISDQNWRVGGEGGCFDGSQNQPRSLSVFEGLPHTSPLLIGKISIERSSQEQQKSEYGLNTLWRKPPTWQSQIIGWILLSIAVAIAFIGYFLSLLRYGRWGRWFISWTLATILIHLGLDQIFFGDGYVSLWLSRLFEI